MTKIKLYFQKKNLSVCQKIVFVLKYFIRRYYTVYKTEKNVFYGVTMYTRKKLESCVKCFYYTYIDLYTLNVLIMLINALFIAKRFRNYNLVSIHTTAKLVF